MYLSVPAVPGLSRSRARGAAVLGSIAAVLIALLWSAAPAGAATVQATPLPFPGGASDLIVGPDGALWFASDERDEVDRFDPGTGALQRFPLARHEDEGEDEGPTALAAGTEGEVWYLTDDGRETGRVSPAGVVQSIYYDDESNLFVGHISAAPGGGVWESVQTNYDNIDSELALLRANGTLTTYAYSGEYSSGGPISTAPDGSAWVGDWGARISAITVAGAVTSFPTAIGSTEEINSIAFAPDGSVWYAGFTPAISAGTAFSSAGGGSIGHLGPGGQQGFKVDRDTLTGSISSAGDGSMWFATRGGVGRIGPSGAYQLGSTAPYQPGIATSPDNLVFGPQGALWFIDNEKSALVRVAVDGALFPPPPAPPAPAPAPPPPGPKPHAPGVRIEGKHVSLQTIEKRHGIPVTCALQGPGACAVSVAAPAQYAKALRLKAAKKAKLVTLGKASKSFTKAGSQAILVKLKPKTLGGLRHLHGSISLSVQATSSAPGATATQATAKLSLRR